MGDKAPAHQNRAEEVDLNRLHPGLPIDFLDRAHRAVDTGVVDEYAAVIQLPGRLLDRGLAILGSGYIAFASENALACRGERLQLAHGFAQQGLAAGHQQHTGPGTDVVAGDGAAQALVGAGDDGGSAREIHRWRVPSPRLKPLEAW